jgi:predicted nucleotidyltransferase
MRRMVTLTHRNDVINTDTQASPTFNINELRAVVADYLGEEASNVYFFGSRIRGDNRNDSDLDVLVISKQKRSMKRNIGGFECDIKYMPFIPNNFRPVV